MLYPIRHATQRLNSYSKFHCLFSYKVMEMAEFPKFDLGSSSCEAFESEQKNLGTQKISVSEHINAFHYSAEKANSFVIDMDAFSPGINKDVTNANSRITKSLSRKESQHGGDRKADGNATVHDKYCIPAICSPKELGAATVVGSCTPEKPVVVTVGSTDHSTNPHSHHQIAVTASNATETKCITRRNSFRRYSSWALDPKRVILLFATLSSMGTMLLIYFTLTVSKQNADEFGADLQH